MAGKISLKTKVVLFFSCVVVMILSACMVNPIDIKTFLADDTVVKYQDEYIEPVKTGTVIKIEDKTGDKLKLINKGKIEGLKDNKYYMIEKVIDGDDAVVEGYPKFVTEYTGLIPGQLIDDLGHITRIKGGSINTALKDAHTYTVSAAAPFFDGLPFTYSDSAGAAGQSVSVKNGAITISAPKGNITLEQLNTLFDGYDVMGVAVSPSALTSASPFYNQTKKTIGTVGDTVTSFQLEGANTEVDYIFVKADESVNFYVLRVSIGAVPPDVIDISAIQGVTKPVAGEEPVTAITETAQYTGTVSWMPAVTGTFAPATVYTATITLTAKAGYTLTGVGANFFTVEDATTVTNLANSGVIAARFPETDKVKIDIPAIQGVTAPATGVAPVTSITPNAQYTGAVAWTPAVTGTFAASTEYTAKITLTAKDGYTFDGVIADFFTVAGAAATNPAGTTSGTCVVTAVFPTTAVGAGNVKFTITFTYADKTTGSGSAAITIGNGTPSSATLTLTVSGGTYDSINWYYNNNLSSSIGTTTTLNLSNTPGNAYLVVGTHLFTAVAVIDGTPYSASFTLTVTE